METITEVLKKEIQRNEGLVDFYKKIPSRICDVMVIKKAIAEAKKLLHEHRYGDMGRVITTLRRNR